MRSVFYRIKQRKRDKRERESEKTTAAGRAGKKKILCYGVGAVVLIIGLLAAVGKIGGSGRPIALDEEETQSAAVAAAADGNWGLSFQQEGEPPVANATSEYLDQFHAYYIDDSKAAREEKYIYLTFDAGYENGYTEKILDVLQEEEVPAAFFLVGNYIEENPELVKRMEEEGHVVGNHTMHHPNMADISEKEEFQKELEELEAAYQEVTGKEMKKYYRPPQGKYSEKNLMQADALGYKTIFWSLAYVDWYEDKQPTREEALNLLNKRIHLGAIVLLHSTSKTNCEIMKELIQGWKEQGYTFRTIEEL